MCFILSPTADSSDVQWVGAWWLGFVVCAIISFMIALPLTCFPQELAGKIMLGLETCYLDAYETDKVLCEQILHGQRHQRQDMFFQE